MMFDTAVSLVLQQVLILFMLLRNAYIYEYTHVKEQVLLLVSCPLVSLETFFSSDLRECAVSEEPLSCQCWAAAEHKYADGNTRRRGISPSKARVWPRPPLVFHHLIALASPPFQADWAVDPRQCSCIMVGKSLNYFYFHILLSETGVDIEKQKRDNRLRKRAETEKNYRTILLYNHHLSPIMHEYNTTHSFMQTIS